MLSPVYDSMQNWMEKKFEDKHCLVPELFLDDICWKLDNISFLLDQVRWILFCPKIVCVLECIKRSEIILVMVKKLMDNFS